MRNYLKNWEGKETFGKISRLPPPKSFEYKITVWINKKSNGEFLMQISQPNRSRNDLKFISINSPNPHSKNHT